MDDDYVLKYVPVMTEEGTAAQFGDLPSDEDFDPSVADQEKCKEYQTLIKTLSKDASFNKALNTLAGNKKELPKFMDFKKRLIRVIIRTKLTLRDIHAKHQESTTTRAKKDADLMRQSMEKWTLSDQYKDCLRDIVAEQLLRQGTYADPFLAQCDAGEVVAFLENLSPLMKRAAKDVYAQTREAKGRNTATLDTKEKLLKQEFAAKLALGIHTWLSITVSGTHEIEEPTVFDQFFVLCCKKAGFGKISYKSDEVQNAAANLKKLIPHQDSKK